MKHNRKFLLTALALMLTAMFVFGAAVAAPATTFSFITAAEDRTLRLETDSYGATYMQDVIGPWEYNIDGDPYIKWTSSDPTIAQVMNKSTGGDDYAALRVFKEGKVTITGQVLDDTGKEIAGLKASKELTYKIVKEESITFDVTELTLSVTSPEEYLPDYATVAPAGASYGKYDLSWSSSDTKVAIVTKSGWLYPRKAGEATITATAKGDPSVTGTIKVVIKEQAISSLTFTETSLELAKGKSFPLNELLEKEGDGTVLYTSSDASIVEVGVTSGEITALKAGEATITASSKKDPSIKAECKVTVTESPVTGITFSQEEYTIYKGVEDKKIGSFVLVPADGNYDNIKFSTANPEIARVSWSMSAGTGILYADGLSVGTATITASVRVDEQTVVTGSFKINVKEFAITSMAFSKAEYALNLNKKTEIELGGKRLIVKPDDYTGIKDFDDINELIIWESSDDTIATVSAYGKVTALAPGKATITAKYSKDASISASAAVVIDTTPVKTLALSKKELTLSENMYFNQEFYAQVEPANAYVKEIYYEVVDPEIATISCNTYLNQPGSSSSKVAYFTVYGGKAGTTDIKVYVDDGTTVHEAVLKLTVVRKEVNLQIAVEGEDDTPVTSLTLPLRKLASRNKRAVNLKAIIVDEITKAKSSSSDPDVVWSTSDKKIATVDRNGSVTVKKAGKVKITATMKDGTKKSASVTIKVVKNLIKKITGNKKITLRVGETDYLSYYLKLVGKNSNIAVYDDTLRYSSSKDDIVSVNDDGMIVANQTGEAKITIKTVDGSKKKFVITVKVVAERQ